MLKTLLVKDSPERKLIFFLLNLFLIWLSWKAILFVLGSEGMPINERLFPALSTSWESFNNSLAAFILERSKNILEILGYSTHLAPRRIWIEGTGGIGMGNYCIGIQLMYYFAMLVIISPMSHLRKAVGIPVGIAITFLLNIGRISGLCLIAKHAPKYMVLAHDHLFNIAVFGALIGLYYFLTREPR